VRDIGKISNISVISKATRIPPKAAVKILKSVIRQDPKVEVDLIIYHVVSERTVTMDELSSVKQFKTKE